MLGNVTILTGEIRSFVRQAGATGFFNPRWWDAMVAQTKHHLLVVLLGIAWFSSSTTVAQESENAPIVIPQTDPADVSDAVPPLVPPAPASDATALTNTSVIPSQTELMRSVYLLRGYTGESVATQSSFLAIQGLKPITFRCDPNGDEWLGYADFRIQTQTGGQALNLGLGGRHLSKQDGLVYGFSSWFDLDGTKQNTFTQFGLSAEVYGDKGELLLNGYIPFGDKSQPSGTELISGVPGFLAQYRVEEAALTGFELQVGHQLPGYYGRRYDVRGFLGYYHFGNSNGLGLDGVLARIRANVGADFELNVIATHDGYFDSSIMIGLEWDISGTLRPPLPDRGYIRNRMKRFHARNQNVVVGKQRFLLP